MSLLALLWLLLALSFVRAQEALPGARPSAEAAVVEETFEVELAGATTTAVLSLPADRPPPYPTVMLLHGSGPMDRDGTFMALGPDGPQRVDGFFDELAERLAAHGIAVLRYDKRLVAPGGEVDYQAFRELGLRDLLDDAAAVLAAARARPEVDDARIFLYGWSEGSTLAAELARRHDVAGIVFQGPVYSSWLRGFERQIREVGIPYLRTFSPDGQVRAETLERAWRGDGGMVARNVVTYLIDPAFFETGEVAVSPFLDRDGNGVIDLEGEFLAGLELTLGFLLSPTGPFWQYSDAWALPTLEKQVKRLRNLPILILQGERDASVAPGEATALAEALRAAGNDDVTLRLYPELGHSLGVTDSVIHDDFQPIAQAPLDDLVDWLLGHLGSGL